MSQLSFASARHLAASIRRRDLSCEELLLHCLGRLDQFNSELNAVVVNRREAAIHEARAADDALCKKQRVGPLHGIPMTIKESYDIAGLATTWGVESLRNNIATTDAVAVRRLKEAGAIFYGKTNVPFMLADIQTYNDIYGTTNNPFDTELAPGGSSGGSAAALAAGLSALESGSDIGGSIRNPAHYCGVFGHKPTWNLIPPRGHSTPGVTAPPDISVIGPMARSAYDLEIALDVMAGPDEIQSQGLKLDLPLLEEKPQELRVALWRSDEQAPVSEEISERVDQVGEVLRQMRVQVNPEARPAFTSKHTNFVYRCLLNATMTARQSDESYSQIEEFVRSIPASDTSTASQVSRAQASSFRQWTQNNELRTRIRWAWHSFFQDYDFVITPIMATVAFPHDHGPMSERFIEISGKKQEMYRQIFWAGLASNAYLPATAIPTGLNENRLPIGVQIIGPEYADFRTIGMAKLLESEGFRFVSPEAYS